MSESTSTATTSATTISSANSSNADDNARKVQQYKDNLINRAETLIVKEFPERIVRLNSLLETPQFSQRSFCDVYQELNIPVPEPIVVEDGVGTDDVEKKVKRQRLESWPLSGGSDGTKVHALPSGRVDCNQPISELILIVKPVIRALVEDSNLLKMWISFMIPKIEDGNNFGVSIQEDTLAEIQSVETEAAAFFDQISRYFVSRAKVVSKVAKYPHIEDYRRAVAELDEKEFLSLWLVLSEVRNRYCSLHDIVIKNMEKLKKPRSSNADSLY
ncbi:proteasome activator complex subunit 3 [Anopheles bellator]|uniref:proteasome activator complex subunit 3 n=1 Tax=Anopheles bellator TaxID=139047 RepID=UPI002649FD91|nr:proteasome activator complex subunit 3 [Anopheles bellator]XP_058063978.1 proteasome activator complex subunit 3 [Anopheles bellator]XP_058063979.1 proteasome activator complex subunit 3 [Anopheles bellator]